MKIKILILSLFISGACFGQGNQLKFGDHGTDIQGHSYPVINGATPLFTFKTTVNQSFVPIVLPAYATGSEPSGNWLIGADADSATNALWYRDGSGTLHRFGSIGGGGGGGATQPFPDNTALMENNSDHTKLWKIDASGIGASTTVTWSVPNYNGTFASLDHNQTVSAINTFAAGQIFGNNTTFGAPTTSAPNVVFTASSAVNPTSPSDGMFWYNGTNLNFRHGSTTTDLLSPSCATCIVDGLNTPSADINIGTSNSHNIVFKANNAIVATFYASDGHVFFGNGSGGDPTQFFYFQGTSRFDGAMTIGANSGFSVINSANFSSSASNSSPSGYGWYWGMNAPFGSGTKSFMRLQPDATLTSGTSSVKGIDISGTINNSGAGTYTNWGIYYNPTLTSLTNTTHIFMENTTGDVKFNTTSGKVSFFGAHILASPTTTLASINFPAGTAVTSPGQGDMYGTTGHLFYRDQSTTYDLLSFSNFYTTNGTLSGDRTITSGGNNLTLLGTGIFTIGSGFALAGVNTSGDNNYTSSVDAAVIVNTPTANRTITLPTASSNTGRFIIVMDRNTSGTFTWSFTNTVLDSGGNTISTLVNGTVYQLFSDGSNYIKIN